WEFIAEHAKRGTTVVYATHYIDEADRYADQVIVLADGELLFAGPPRELERVVHEASGQQAASFEASFVAFLRQKGH
ncbi:MAG: type transport system ATP-binding protein, partial [Solirubrobacteraceae bacterium]|nr:type transport system ATP-binding protein [Solirubrobacteraceae bacterium]